MKKSNKLVFFGNERIATGLDSTDIPALKTLIGNGYDVQAVVSSYTKGHSRSARELEIAEIAKKNGIPLLLPEDLKDIKEELESYQANAAVLVAYGKIIPKEIIGIFPAGIINIHPSLLPKYRGPTPIEQAILDGINETGVSLMRLTPEMDAGPVFAQSKLALNGRETKRELAEKLLRLGGELLLNYLPKILNGSAEAAPQNDKQATYTNLLYKEDGNINWNQPAVSIERQIRAFAGFPKSRTDMHGYEVVITKARVAENEGDGSLVMKCQPGWLEILELTAPSGKLISGADFLRGYVKS